MELQNFSIEHCFIVQRSQKLHEISTEIADRAMSAVRWQDLAISHSGISKLHDFSFNDRKNCTISALRSYHFAITWSEIARNRTITALRSQDHTISALIWQDYVISSFKMWKEIIDRKIAWYHHWNRKIVRFCAQRSQNSTISALKSHDCIISYLKITRPHDFCTVIAWSCHFLFKNRKIVQLQHRNWNMILFFAQKSQTRMILALRSKIARSYDLFL